MEPSSVGVRATCNWIRSAGCEVSKAIQLRLSHEDIFIKPKLDEILSETNAILLSSPPENDSACELQINVHPSYKIEAVCMVCSVPKLEVFFGSLKEYVETVYGAITEDDGEGQVFSYRYDVEVQKSGVVDLALKLLTSSDEICIFGILLQVAPNPNGITTGINMENVQKLLSSCNQKMSPNAEKCMLFMQNQDGSAAASSKMPRNAFLEHMKEMFASKPQQPPHPIADKANKNVDLPSDLPPTLDNIIKAHIDVRLRELEEKVLSRLNELEIQYMAKLDRILYALEKNKD